MQIDLLYDLVEEMAGEGTGRIVNILFKKKDVNEFLIAKKMELTINQVRNILYKLSADNLVSFVRKKDKRKGWYIYYWTLNTEKCLMKLGDSLQSKIDNFERTLNSRETKRFYVCTACDIEVGEEKALEHQFSCEECADIYQLSDNAKPIRDAKTWITKTKKNLQLMHNELSAVQKKLYIARKRASNKLKKEEKVKKDLMKAIRAAARKKVAGAKAKTSRGGRWQVAGGRKIGSTKKKVVKKAATLNSVPSKKGTKVPSSSGKKKVTKKAVKKVVKKKASLVSKLKKKLKGK